VTNLSEIPFDRPARIHTVDGDLAVALMELGLVPGTRVRVMRSAPLGDPLQVDVSGAQLAIRKRVAADVLVELL
jgi:Fe2+ transport system protein FeoA